MDEPLETVLISSLEHWSYCPRQCGLIHLEQVWDENLYTLRGRQAHERADEPGTVVEHGIRIVRGMPLWSDRLGLYGKADIVEFHRGEDRSHDSGMPPTPFPVEYKVGERRQWLHEAIQLCAQALCLEEMLDIAVPAGAVYYHGSHRRREVSFDQPLRERTQTAILEVRQMLLTNRLPPAVDDARCPNCSLIESCLPRIIASRQRQAAFRSQLYRPVDDAKEDTA